MLNVAAGVCDDPVAGLELHGLLAVICKFYPAAAGCFRTSHVQRHVWQELAVHFSVGADTLGVLSSPRTCKPTNTARARVGTEHAGKRSV